MRDRDLPSPPEGYYFRVTEVGISGVSGEVQLVDGRTNQVVRYYPLSLGIFPDARSAVRNGMQYLIDSHLESQGRSRKLRELREIVGVYR